VPKATRAPTAEPERIRPVRALGVAGLGTAAGRRR
jgi:hypothetical protein